MSGRDDRSQACDAWPCVLHIQAIRTDLDELYLQVRTLSASLATTQARFEETSRDLREVLGTVHQIQGRLNERASLGMPDWRALSKLGAALLAVLSLAAGAVMALAERLSTGK